MFKISKSYWDKLQPHEQDFFLRHCRQGEINDCKLVVKVARQLFPGRTDITLKMSHIEADGMKHYYMHFDGAYPPKIVLSEPV